MKNRDNYVYHHWKCNLLSYPIRSVQNNPKSNYNFISRFIEFMLDWERNEMPEYMDIAFNSERSIEVGATFSG